MRHSHLLPDGLVLTPVSRAPLRLPARTVAAVSSMELPAGRVELASAPAVSIVVVTYNNWLFTKLCLTSLLANTPEPEFEVIVVDNGSVDGTRDYVAALAQTDARIRPIFNGRNAGFAAANNLGLAEARGGTLILLNNDTIVPPGWLARLTRWVDDPRIGAVGPVTNRIGNEAEIETCYQTYGEFLRFAAAHVEVHQGQAFDIGTAAMFCLALHRAVYQQVGPLDERFAVGMLEDDDYSRRLRVAGYRVVCAEDVYVHHFGKASFSHLIPTGEYAALLRANQQRFAEKWGTPWEPYRRRPNRRYQQLTDRIRRVVRTHVPDDATVAVVSKGDSELLNLGHCPAQHFPHGEDGAFAGYYPADSTQAIQLLEDARARGAHFLLLPQTAFWWLDHYRGFSEHLRRRYQAIVWQADTCALFALRPAATSEPRRGTDHG